MRPTSRAWQPAITSLVKSELDLAGATTLSFANNPMTAAPSLIGTWIGRPKGSSIPSSPPECIWHVVDCSTCVYEQQTEMGLMVSWFQYWLHEEGILRYPLTKTTRSMYRKGGSEYVPIIFEGTHLTMHEYRFDRAGELPIPDRFDIFPGTRPDESGSPIPHSFRSKVLDHLPEPPIGEQDASSNGG
jgi:hypothetical protein